MAGDSNVENRDMVDKVKIAAGSGCAWCAASPAYYYFSDTALVLRVLMVMGGLIAAGGVAWLSAPGKEFFAFAQEAWAEAGRVSWPTRKETMQTTGDRVRVRRDHGAVPVLGGHDARMDREAADRAGRT